MSWHAILYQSLLLFVTLYVLWRGGAPERIVVIVWIASNVLSTIAHQRAHWRFVEPETAVLYVDLATFLAFGIIALVANRTWILFVCAMQLCGVSVHLSKLARPEMLPFGYALGQLIWSYPILAAILVGTHRHHLLSRKTWDPAWKPFWRSSIARKP